MNLTNKLGELRESNIGDKVRVAGWVAKKRNLGELIFIDLRDRTGVSQIVVDKDNANYELINRLKNEYVVYIEGEVRQRSSINEKIPTGKIEIDVENAEIINKSEPVPLLVNDEDKALEDTRLEYRYLDIRRPSMYNNLKLRHTITKTIRRFLDDKTFIEVETPILTKSTPEGARDYLVPSRVNEGTCYALPQSPQIYKNLLMIGGMERYYQIAKCFRDEDLRADRQPEFTQVDIETSFMSQDEIRDLTEEMVKEVVREVKGVDLGEDFLVMPYDLAMDKYGSDKPDIRFELFLNDVTDIFSDSEFKVFKEAPMVKMIKVPGEAENYSRKKIDQMEELAKKNHAKGLAWMKMFDELTGPIAKFFSSEEKNTLLTEYGIESGDLLFFVADDADVVNQSLSAVRTELGKELELYNPNELAFLWIVDWPMFEYDTDLQRYFAVHHPFTMPHNKTFSENPLETRAEAYDLVLNGYELGGGSIRINNPELQMEMFKILGMEDEEIREDFGFLLDAYKYGAPYHGGIALGLDRFAMILSGSESIRDVIAFPKNARAREVMINSPANVTDAQLNELGIEWKR